MLLSLRRRDSASFSPVSLYFSPIDFCDLRNLYFFSFRNTTASKYGVPTLFDRPNKLLNITDSPKISSPNSLYAGISYNSIHAFADLNRPVFQFAKNEYETANKLGELAFLYNLTGAFFKIFGVYYDIHYFPLPRVFTSEARMQNLISGAANYLQKYVTRSSKALL